MRIGTSNRRVALLGTFAISVLLLLSLGASAASAEVQWRIESFHGPQNMKPDSVGQYVLLAYNTGDTDAEGSVDPIRVTDTLPPGVTAISASEGVSWTCGATGGGPVLGASSVTCESTSMFVRAPGEHGLFRGAVPPVMITVDVPPGISGVHDNSVEISGGGAAQPATDTDPTPFGDVPTAFGFVPGSFAADLFDAEFPAGSPEHQAGSHPFELRIDFDQNLGIRQHPGTGRYFTEPVEDTKTLETLLPPGLIGNPEAMPKCKAIQLNDVGPSLRGSCPANTQLGLADFVLQDGSDLVTSAATGAVDGSTDVPLFNMEPPAGAAAAFAFSINSAPVWIRATLAVDENGDTTVLTRVENQTKIFTLRSLRLTLWGVPADPAHDHLRLDPSAPSPETNYGESFTGAPIRPFLTLPTQCDVPAGAIRQRMDSWQAQGQFTPWVEGADIHASGCEDPRFRFEPTISIKSTSREAASPTGLEIDLHVPQKDDTVTDPADLYSQSGDDRAIVIPNLRNAVTRLPLGMAVNPSIADGLTGCSRQQIRLDDTAPPACPDSSKFGTVEIESPLTPHTLKGSIYQAKQSDSPHGSLLGFYTVAEGPGMTIKLAARVDSDPETGQLTTTFLDSPQLAFTHYRLRFNGGPRAPLVNPPTCGTHRSTARFTAWNSSVPAVDTGDSFELTSGPNGAPCPNGLGGRSFAPSFDAKSLTPIAGAFSQFALEASRDDGTQELRGLETTLPPGMLAKLAGVPYCPEAALAAISAAAGTGLGERLDPSCPAASLVGHSDAAAGAGSLPFHNPGNVYLTGPYKGAPLGLAVVTPIVAGPLDLGSIVVRAALRVDPRSARATVVSDPIPDKLVAEGNGFLLNVRSVRVAMDRPSFTLNPTSCAEMAVGGVLTSLQGTVASLSERFQVGACAALGFKPALSMRLFGKTNRGAHPRLRATLRMPNRGANITRAAVALPRSAILDQSHIGTVCTRMQFAADECPAASVYGRARAFTSLLDQPLEGPVYLRSSNNELPDLVADLGGQISVELVGRIDTNKARRIRATFDLVPDAPVSKFVLTMQGGKKGLLQNSRNLCKRAYRAVADFDAHNGRIADLHPKVDNSCGRKSKQDKRR